MYKPEKNSRIPNLYRATTVFCGILSAVSLLGAALLVAPADTPFPEKNGLCRLRLQGYGNAPEPQPLQLGDNIYQRIEEKDGGITASYGFVSFNREKLRIVFSVAGDVLADYRQDYGYLPTELEALAYGQNKALAEAYQNAVKKRHSQAQLDRGSQEIRLAYRQQRDNLLRARGFRLLSETSMVPDIPGIVQRSVAAVRPLAQALDDAVGHQGKSTGNVVLAALSMVQTALVYENIPLEIDGRITGGILPPLVALAQGKGDCDSKTALLAAILLNWDQMRLVGIGVPDHYLMGILGNPAKGEIFAEYDGLTYILMEPAGPAWLPPGTLAPHTLELLNAGLQMAVEPLQAK